MLEEMGYPNVVTKSVVNEFKACGGRRRKVAPDTFYGISKEALRAFVMKLPVPLVMSKNLYTGQYQGTTALKELGLKDGFYIVAGNQDGVVTGGTWHVLCLKIT
jgi:hypothetical protein